MIVRFQPQLYFTSKNNEINSTSKEKSQLYSKPNFINKIEPETKKKLTIGAVFASIGTILTGIVCFFRGKSPSAKVSKLIKKLKPQNIELAKELYPTLLRNSENLSIKPEQFNLFLLNIEEQNVKFMADEGIDLISDNMKNIKGCVSNIEDLLTLSTSLNKNNKSTFNFVSKNMDTLKIEELSDLIFCLSKLDPKDKEYAYKTLLPLLKKHEELLKLRTPEKYVSLLNHVTPEIQKNVISIANTSDLNTKHTSKVDMILALNKNNTECLPVLLDNKEKIDRDARIIFKMLNSFNNSNVSIVKNITNNYSEIKHLGATLDDVIKILPNVKASEIFDLVVKNKKLYYCDELNDLKPYLNDLKDKDLDFIKKEVEPRLQKYAEELNLNAPDFVSEVIKNICPKTVNAIDSVAIFSKENPDIACSWGMLSAVTPENISKLPEALKNIRKTELIDSLAIIPNDCKIYLDSLI